MTIRRLTLTTILGATGVLLIAGASGVACAVTPGDTTDGGTSGTSGTGTSSTGTSSTGTDGGTTGDDGGGTGTSTATGGGDDGGVIWTSPPDPSKVYARFVVATSDLTTGTGFDICYLPWDGVKGTSPSDAYTGPIAQKVGSSDGFTSPEVTLYFPLEGVATDGKIRVRLVGKGTDCTTASRFTYPSLGGISVSIDDYKATGLKQGYNTVIIYGNAGTASTHSLQDVYGEDPTAAPTVPTLQFFNAYKDSALSTLTFSFKGTDGKDYSFSGFGSGLGYGTYTALPLVFSGSWGGAIGIDTGTFSLSGAAAVNIKFSAFSLTQQYYWTFFYGSSPTDAHLYICADAVATATASNVAVKGCTYIDGSKI